jgi:putative radical SAM enzyme (TIGR03279 family)
MHTQIVLLPGVNDGPHLDQTIDDLARRYPAVQSIGVVPVGLTRERRQGCRLYTQHEARAVIDQVIPMQTIYRGEIGVSLAYLADEWYLLAGRDLPPGEMYDGYPQIENGIGLVRQFLDDSVNTMPVGKTRITNCTLACGTLIAPILKQTARDLALASGTNIQVVPVVNDLFGETVTVSGLLGGRDVVSALQGLDLGEVVFLPAAMFAEGQPGPVTSESDEKHTLDDLTMQEIGEAIACPVVAADRMSEVWNELVTPSRSAAG